MTGYGVGGAIDGLRLEETITKGSGVPFDPAVPYLGTATIKPATVNTSVVLDDFADGIVTHWTPWSSGTPQLLETNGQLTVRGTWNRLTGGYLDQAGAYWNQSWSVVDGQTLECRADVVKMNQDASVVGIGLGTASQRYYVVKLASDRISLDRWMAPSSVVPLFSDSVAVRQTNIVLSFALTRRQSQAVVTVRVLDKATPGSVLYQKSVLDVAPYLEDNNLVVVAMEPKPELPNPDASATFDNLELRTYEVPQLGIERAVQLTWPATGMNYAVEGGPTVQGPWLSVPDVATPGLKQMTVPANDVMKFFRLQQAP